MFEVFTSHMLQKMKQIAWGEFIIEVSFMEFVHQVSRELKNVLFI